ncbi:MAG: endonuclease/exonuclease/phosphatase family protein [Gemmatimonadota bacterium]|nr:endonuclease/exonuclease/phosphatase family protein [Gemmatimonadota bacterium]
MRMRGKAGRGNRSARALVALVSACVLGMAASGATLSAQTIRIAAYNIRHGRGMDDRVDLERIAAVLETLDADVITLQEVDDRTERTGGVDQVSVLAERLGYRGVHGPHRPYQGGHYGNAVLSRLPIRSIHVFPIPPASGSALSVLEVEVELAEAGAVSVVSVHLAGSSRERLAQADAVTGHLRVREHPVVLAGDLNERPWGPVMDRLRSSWRVLAKSGDPTTYPAETPDREIDFVLVRRSDFVDVLAHHVLDEPLASDHRPIVAELRFPYHTHEPGDEPR